MNRHYTSIEQGKKLLELGLSPETADMYYAYVLPHSDKIKHNPENGDPISSLRWYNKGYTNGKEPLSLEDFCVPCWSVGALLEVMPNVPDYTIIFAKAEGKYGMCITPLDSGLALNEVEADTPIEAAYRMMCWFLENNYIKNVTSL